MGVDIEIFVDPQECYQNELLCAICKGVLENPMQTRCQHMFCFDCITQWLNTEGSKRVCPMDRKPLRVNQLLKVPKAIECLINNLRIRCKYYNKGCTFTLKLESLAKLRQHQENECEHGLMLAEIALIKVEKKQLEVRLEQAHQNMQIKNGVIKNLNGVIKNLRTDKDRYKDMYNAARLKIEDSEKSMTAVKEQLEVRLEQAHQNLRVKNSVIENLRTDKGRYTDMYNAARLKIENLEKSLNSCYKDMYNAAQLRIEDLEKSCDSLHKQLQDEKQINIQQVKKRKITNILGDMIREQEESKKKKMSRLQEEEESTRNNLSQLKNLRSQLGVLEKDEESCSRGLLSFKSNF